MQILKVIVDKKTYNDIVHEHDDMLIKTFTHLARKKYLNENDEPIPYTHVNICTTHANSTIIRIAEIQHPTELTITYILKHQ